MKEKLFVVKIGGNVIDDETLLNDFLKSFSKLQGHRILVHGGGKIATEIGKQMGIQPNIIEGRRITDARTLKLVMMVYGGLVNKSIVTKLQAVNCNAVGLSGADCNTIEAVKRPVTTVDYGWVGDVVKVNTDPIIGFTKQRITPVFMALTHDGQGNMLNTNADTIATTLAIALSSIYQTTLVFCFEKKGVMFDVNDENSVISSLDYSKYQGLKNGGVIVDGMIPKLDNAFDAISNGVAEVKICAAEEFLKWAKNGESIGTTLQ